MKRRDRALGITRPEKTEVDVEAHSIWNQSMSASWMPEKGHPAAGQTQLLGVESTSFGFVGRLLIAPTSLLTMLLILSANISAMMSRLQKKELPRKAVCGIPSPCPLLLTADQLFKVSISIFLYGTFDLYVRG